MTALPSLGLDGKNGTEIPDSTDIDYLTSLGFKYLPGSESGPSYEIQEYHFQGTSGTRGTDGGHGGCGGPGGLQGKSFILGFENSAKFSVKGSDGTILNKNTSGIIHICFSLHKNR